MYNYGNPLYFILEAAKLQLSPLRMGLTGMQQYFNNCDNSSYHDFYHTLPMRSMRASVEIAERMTRQYSKPEFGITETIVDGKTTSVEQVTILKKSFCNLLHFKKAGINHPKLLIVAPMSGHHATLLRGTVEGILPHCDVYITDWICASQVPASEGSFDMDDYINYVIEFLEALGPDVHVMGVCQPAVPVLAAVSIMSDGGSKALPTSMILMGGPVDARKSPTIVDTVATSHDIDWFKDYLLSTVPANYPGFGRKVYPGSLQIAGFVSMKWKDHFKSHIDLFKNLLVEDDAAATKQKDFYDEYFAVMDLTSEFYIQTIQEVFQKFSLAEDSLVSRGRKVHLGNIHNVALLGIEGENDDIAGLGQTSAAFALCKNLPESYKEYYLQKDVGHYGVFSGSKFRKYVVPVIKDFIYKWDASSKSVQVNPSTAQVKSRKASKK
ncbi:MAG: polyhydroxyalkanoate depolymerase [Pseudomonadota bacterium]